MPWLLKSGDSLFQASSLFVVLFLVFLRLLGLLASWLFEFSDSRIGALGLH